MRNYNGLPEHDREKLYHKAEYLARKAIEIESTNALSHFYLALALGRLSDKASNKVKISYAREIRISCERAIMLNPNLAGPYHILGRWHQEVSGFNVLEKAFIATFYGKSLENGTYEEAFKNFKIALRLDPQNPIHHYEIAHTYFHRNEPNDKEKARTWLRKALTIPARNDDDLRTHKKVRIMLKKVGG
jgi:tetratricopeptide (TPR) repeat protein